MDKRLFEAALTGNVSGLYALLDADPLILHSVALSTGGDTPLHVASMAGHPAFAREILNLRPEFALELNGDGHAAIHVAAANGAADIVRGLAEIDGVCLLRGKEGRIALHYAASKGRTSVIEELMLAIHAADSMQAVTARGETAPHLAVKNNQFEAFAALVGHVKRLEMIDVLNEKDDHGNTLLHIAASRKNYQVIDLVLREHTAPNGIIDVNSRNAMGLTPLDLLLLFHSDAGDREIEGMLRRSGAATSEEIRTLVPPRVQPVVHPISRHATGQHSEIQSQEVPSNCLDGTATRHVRSRTRRFLRSLRDKESEDNPEKARDVLLVVFALIATATYQTGISPPGGSWQADSAEPLPANSSTPYYAGAPIWMKRNRGPYVALMSFNSFGFYTSLVAIFSLTRRLPMWLDVNLSITALFASYALAVNFVPGPNSSWFGPASLVFASIVLGAIILLRRYLYGRKRASLSPTNPQAEPAA